MTFVFEIKQTGSIAYGQYDKTRPPCVCLLLTSLQADLFPVNWREAGASYRVRTWETAVMRRLLVDRGNGSKRNLITALIPSIVIGHLVIKAHYIIIVS